MPSIANAAFPSSRREDRNDCVLFHIVDFSRWRTSVPNPFPFADARRFAGATIMFRTIELFAFVSADNPAPKSCDSVKQCRDGATGSDYFGILLLSS